LFLIFINDIDLAAADIEALVKFADDTKVGQTIRTEADRAALQTALTKLCEWTEKWGMKFNVVKCKVMHFGRHNPRYEYEMDGMKLQEVEEERERHWDIGELYFETGETLCEGGRDGQSGPRTDNARLSF
jgi:hypothetical protein